MKNSFATVSSFIKKHKIWSTIGALIVIVIIIVAYRKTHTASAQTRYVLGTVERGTLLTTVSGTGQIAATNEIDIKPKVSADVTSVKVLAGQSVKAGDVIAQLDATDALKAYRDAQQNLTAAQISYQKTVQSSQTSVTNSQQDLQKSLDDGFNAMTDAFSSLPTMISDENDILYNGTHSPYLSNTNLNTVSSSAVDYKMSAGLEFDAARNEYTKNLADFRAITRSSDQTAIINVINETYQTMKDLSNSQKDLLNVINLVHSLTATSSEMNTDVSVLNDYINKTNSSVSDLYSAKTGIISAQQTLSQNTASLNGSDTLDIQSAKLALEQKQSALSDARDTVADYTIRAPIDGVIGKVDINVGQSASSGTAVASIISPQSIATVSLNEVDIAKVAVGQQVTITFDAIPDLTITGKVAAVDQIGTVTQGVVSYNVTISFDTQDQRVKPGMSMSASIITDAKPDVLLVPSTAIKTLGSAATVQVVTGSDASNVNAVNQTGIVLSTPPQTVTVQTGSSNDSDTEVTSGLKEGDVIVVRTVTGTTNTTTSTQRTTAGGGGLFGGGNGGGAVRALR